MAEFMMPSLKDEKKSLRAVMREKRSLLSPAEKAERDWSIERQILEFIKHHPLLPVYCYISMEEEISTHRLIELLWKDSISVAVPRVEGKEIVFCEIRSWKDVKTGYMGIWEPLQEMPQVNWKKGIVITPGLAFDRQGNRMGYGGGYYDRFFEKHQDLIKVGAGYDFQVVNQLVVETTDVPLDYIITD